MFFRTPSRGGKEDVDMVDVAAKGETGDEERDSCSNGYDGSQIRWCTRIKNKGWRCPEHAICEDYDCHYSDETQADRWD